MKTIHDFSTVGGVECFGCGAGVPTAMVDDPRLPAHAAGDVVRGGEPHGPQPLCWFCYKTAVGVEAFYPRRGRSETFEVRQHVNHVAAILLDAIRGARP